MVPTECELALTVRSKTLHPISFVVTRVMCLFIRYFSTYSSNFQSSNSLEFPGNQNSAVIAPSAGISTIRIHTGRGVRIRDQKSFREEFGGEVSARSFEKGSPYISMSATPIRNFPLPVVASSVAVFYSFILTSRHSSIYRLIHAPPTAPFIAPFKERTGVRGEAGKKLEESKENDDNPSQEEAALRKSKKETESRRRESLRAGDTERDSLTD